MDIIGYISDNVDLTTQEKTDMLDDFCSARNYTGTNTVAAKKAFVNQEIKDFLTRHVNGKRRTDAVAAVEITELELMDL